MAGTQPVRGPKQGGGEPSGARYKGPSSSYSKLLEQAGMDSVVVAGLLCVSPYSKQVSKYVYELSYSSVCILKPTIGPGTFCTPGTVVVQRKKCSTASIMVQWDATLSMRWPGSFVATTGPMATPYGPYLGQKDIMKHRKATRRQTASN
eukprot:3246392-Rhodomonas_salina.1